MKKSEISEILDGDGNLIGNDNKPENNPNLISVDGTTDFNAGVSHQHYGGGYMGNLGSFGYYFNESEGQEPLNVQIAKEAYNFFDSDSAIDGTGFEGMADEVKEKYVAFADKIVALFTKDDKGTGTDDTLAESEVNKIIEDVLTDKKKDNSLSFKKDDNDIMSDKVKKIKSLFSDLSDRDKGDLIKQLK